MPGLVDRCAVCSRQYPYSLARCAVCRRSVCGDCVVRMAGAVFCGRVCAHAFHYGGAEDVDEDEREPEEEE